MTTEYDGHHYTVTTEGGEVWSFDELDADLNYIREAIAAWREWEDYVKSGKVTPEP